MRSSIIFIAILIVYSCGKDKDMNSKNTVVTGTAFYKNRFAQDSTQLMPYKTGEVFVRNFTDNKDSYFTKTVTDTDGKFYFNLNKLPVILYIKPIVELDVDNIIPLYGVVTINKENASSAQLIASFDTETQNGFLLKVKDEAGGFVTGATAHLYSSEAIAALNNPASAIATLITNNSGIIYKTNLPIGNYFINIKKTIDTVSFQRLLKLVSIPATGFIQDTMVLKKTSTHNGFNFTLKDSTGGNLVGANANLYHSELAAASNNPSLAIETFLSDNGGKVSKLTLADGTYFINASKSINGISYQRIGKQFTVAGGVVIDTILLRPRFSNSFTITVKDSLDGVISGANVYLFTSEVMANSNDPNAAIDNFTTDNSGQFSKGSLAPSTYFINATKIVGNITYQRLGKRVVVTNSGFITDTIILRKQ